MNMAFLWAAMGTLAVAIVGYLIHFIVSGRDEDGSGLRRCMVIFGLL